MPDSLQVGIVQMSCVRFPETNVQEAARVIRDLKAQGADIVCLPELFASPYFCQTEDHRHFAKAELLAGPLVTSMADIAREIQVALIVPFFEERAPGLYHNSAAVIDADGSVLGCYRKMHIPDDPGYYEKFYFTPGDRGFQAFTLRNGARIGVLICWDQWFPEAARLTAMAGADVLFFPTAIGWHSAEKAKYGASQVHAWRTIQASHAIANGCYTVTVNRTGFESCLGAEGLDFWGQSFVVNPQGEEVAHFDEPPRSAVVKLDLTAIRRTREHWPFFRDRRVDEYGGLMNRWGGR